MRYYAGSDVTDDGDILRCLSSRTRDQDSHSRVSTFLASPEEAFRAIPASVSGSTSGRGVLSSVRWSQASLVDEGGSFGEEMPERATLIGAIPKQ